MAGIFHSDYLLDVTAACGHKTQALIHASKTGQPGPKSRANIIDKESNPCTGCALAPQGATFVERGNCPRCGDDTYLYASEDGLLCAPCLKDYTAAVRQGPGLGWHGDDLEVLMEDTALKTQAVAPNADNLAPTGNLNAEVMSFNLCPACLDADKFWVPTPDNSLHTTGVCEACTFESGERTWVDRTVRHTQTGRFWDVYEEVREKEPTMTTERTLRVHLLLKNGIPLWGAAVTTAGRVLVNRPPFLAAAQEVARFDTLDEATSYEEALFHSTSADFPATTHVRTVRTDEQGREETSEYPIRYGGKEEEPTPQQAADAIHRLAASPEAEADIRQTVERVTDVTLPAPTVAPIKAEALGLAADLDLRKGDLVTLRVPAWMMRPAPDGKGLASRILEGRITALTQSGLQFEGAATVRDCEWCHRCGRAIQHPASLRVGYGPICSDKLGIDWSLDGLDEAAIQALKDRIKRDTYVTDMWLPRRSVAVLEQTHPAQADQDLDLRLMALIKEKGGTESKTLGWIERHYGDWYSLQPVQKQTVLDEIAEFPPARGEKAPALRQDDRSAPTARAWVVGLTIFVASPYSPENAAISRSIRYGRWSPQAPNPAGAKPGAWTYPAQGDTAHQIAEAWAQKGLETDDEFKRLVAEYRQRREAAATDLVDVI